MADHLVIIRPGDARCVCGKGAMPGFDTREFAYEHARTHLCGIEYADATGGPTLNEEVEQLRNELALERAKAIRLRRALDAALESE